MRVTGVSRVVVLGWLLCIGPMFLASAWAQSQTVTAEGMAGILQGDQGLARDNAIQDALRKAVEQAVGTMVAAETLVENFQVIRDNVLSKSQGYIQKYSIVKEGAQKDLYSVTIAATVAIGNLKNDLAALGLLMARVGKPRTLFMVAEQNIGQEIAIYWWSWWGRGGAEFKGQTVDMAVSETALKEEFLAKGFNVVDISSATGKFEISNAYRIADLTNDGAREFGRKLNAEVVVKGKALAKEGPRTAGSSVGSYLADITLSAIRVDNGQVLASARGQGVARHVAQHTGGNEALERAARNAAEKLIEQIVAKWTGETSGGQLVQLTIKGIARMKDLVKIKEFLQSQVRGVQSVIQRSFEGGVAVLEVDAKATAQQIGDELVKKDFEGFDLDVTGATANTLEVVAARKGAAGPAPVEVPKAMAPPPRAPRPAQPEEPKAVASAPKVAPLSTGPSEDRHWIQPDDYFIADQAYQSGYLYVELAKMTQPPTDKTKGQAEFFNLHDSKNQWTKHFWKTRPAEEADLKIGALAICFEGHYRDHVYRAPEHKDSARTRRWFLGRVTDTSDLFKGAVRIDKYNCSLEAARVPVQ